MEGVFGPVPVATAGVCVFGQGDCGPKVNNVSQTFSQILTENIKNTLISKSTSIGAVMATDQTIDMSGADMSMCESVEISGISQKAVVSYNFSMIETSIDESNFTDMVRNSVEKTLKQSVDAKSEALNGGNTGVVNNVDQTYNNSVDRLVNSISYNDFKSIMSEMKSRQKINLSGMKLGGKYCKITNLSQDVMMEYASKLMSDKITKEFVSIAKENESKSSTESKNTFAASGVLGDLGRGISGITASFGAALGNVLSVALQPMMMFGIVLLVAIIAYVIYRAMMSGKAEGMVKDVNATDDQGKLLGEPKPQEFNVSPAISGVPVASAPVYQEESQEQQVQYQEPAYQQPQYSGEPLQPAGSTYSAEPVQYGEPSQKTGQYQGSNIPGGAFYVSSGIPQQAPAPSRYVEPAPRAAPIAVSSATAATLPGQSSRMARLLASAQGVGSAVSDMANSAINGRGEDYEGGALVPGIVRY